MHRNARGVFVIASVAWALSSACSDDVEAIEAAQRRRVPREHAVPVGAIGGGIDPATGRPFGYPEDAPMVPSPIVMSGGVEPGAIRTAIVRYEMPMDEYLRALEHAIEAAGFRVASDVPSVQGGHRIRIAKERREISFVVTPESGSTRVDVIAADLGARSGPR